MLARFLESTPFDKFGDRGLRRGRSHFAAADFKQCPKTKRMLFLDVNSGPMFAAFDAASQRAVSRALVRALRR